ncbi:MAG: TraB/GumN family protein [Pseudobacteriovorax sp.]|nr:TraB/GumN family protein [Pseudobacteriovorax sp.]
MTLYFKTLITALLLSSLFQSSCTTTSQTTGAQGEPTMLWKLSKDGVPASFILGTVHVGYGYEELEPVVKKSFKETEQFVSELSLDDLSPQKAMSVILAKPGQSVFDKLPKEDFNLLSEQLAAMIPPQFLKKMSVAGVMSILTVKDAPKSEPLDSTLMKMAKELNKPSFPLESLDQQMIILEDVFSIEMLKFAIKNPKILKESITELLEVYRKKDMDRLLALAKEPGHPELAMDDKTIKLILTSRNEAWVAPLEKHLSKKSTFVAVGAAHLPGDKGVLKLLENRGFKVERVYQK